MNDDALVSFLESAKTIGVVGLSDKEWRASHGVARYLQSQGFRIVPVNPRISESLGEKAVPDLDSAGEGLDIVLVFRRSEYVSALVEPAIRSGAKLFWMQVGVSDSKAAAKLEEAGLAVVMDRCLMVEHMRLARSR
jgi:uncharacterized protein